MLAITTLISGCKKNDLDDELQVPRVPTDISIDIDLPSYSALNNPGGAAYVNGGSKGIIIYRIGIEEFSAFDRHCTYQVADGCQVFIIDGSFVKDTLCCESVFNIISGAPFTGTATRPLLSYQTQYNPNANVLRVFN